MNTQDIRTIGKLKVEELKALIPFDLMDGKVRVGRVVTPNPDDVGRENLTNIFSGKHPKVSSIEK